MKRILLLLALCSSLSACKSPQDTARLGSLADLAITYSQRKGVLSDADVEALRSAAMIVLPPIEAAKNPKVGLQP